MRILLSSLCGIVGAMLCYAALDAITTLSHIELLGTGIAIAALLGNHAYGLRIVRRAAVRSRILLGGTGIADADASPEMAGAARTAPVFESRPVSRRSFRELTNPMWVTYAFLACWALHEALGVSDDPIATASASMPDAVGAPAMALVEPDLQTRDTVASTRGPITGMPVVDVAGPDADAIEVLHASTQSAVATPTTTVRLQPRVRVTPTTRGIDTQGT